MAYTTPPQANYPSSYNNTGSSYIRSVQDPSSVAVARNTIAADFQRSSVLEVVCGDNGKPTRAYIRDASGQLRTVTFDAQQHIVGSQTGLE